jgi:hypothetical protein
MDAGSKWKEFVNSMNTRGIALPMARDPKTGEGSVAVTLVVVSGGLCTMTVLMMLASIISKLTGFFAINDQTINSMREAFYSSIQFFIAAYAGYLGRKFQKDEKSIFVDLDSNQKSSE